MKLHTIILVVIIANVAWAMDQKKNQCANEAAIETDYIQIIRNAKKRVEERKQEEKRLREQKNKEFLENIAIALQSVDS